MERLLATLEASIAWSGCPVVMTAVQSLVAAREGAR